MTLLDHVRNALQRPERPAGDVQALAQARQAAYEQLFGGAALRVIPHEDFGKPANMGGRIDVHLYEFDAAGTGRVVAAVTSGMSDYEMRGAAGAVRREMIQYFRECRAEDVARLHNSAWIPLAARYCLDFFETQGPYPDEKWPGCLFLPPLVKPHAEFGVRMDRAEMKLLWQVPLRQAELDFKIAQGTNALLGKMQECQLPWVFDEESRPPLV